MIEFEDTEKRITEDELASAEKEIGHRLPDSFRRHYLEHNGGIPSPAVFPGDDDWEEIEVATFFPIKYHAQTEDLKRTVIEGKYRFMLERGVIPSRLLPFAGDHGGNFFCLDLEDGSVSFFATDAFDSDLTQDENHRKAERRLAGSFDEFLAALSTSDEA